ncbi:phosphatidylinositol mannoside acyltransferase [Saccharothrix coeruleofusca]|uniref:Lipid A biosynthesis lauroyl acyltransferase n=1 Tax=Saccharothrix coeruleofusca TaxID=33919 RepID=A0A918EEM8_9PSEU|nr:phosphatidylinositol mannoside acyltransferase [Saccharothrix coeruleofusca]MBP2337123.1 KDO2-lipid IV(A) lauroyltransferase [Saccharothrix coeruleofusca]GGP66963.1 lipid A biosynthesis lauroyl acyltransferase [Saccharothrix coeruleofusca]
MRERLADLAYAAGWRLVRVLPEPVARALFDRAADWAARRGGEGVRQLRANLRRVVPKAGEQELDELVRLSLRSYARYWREAFRLPSMDLEAAYAACDEMISGHENLDAALAEGRGVVAALPHCGNWDMAGVWLVGHTGGFTTVVERLKPESLYRRFVRFRESLGFEVLPLTGGERPVAAVLAERLRQNKVVCLLADRDLTAGGIPVTFFGERTMMPAGPAHLAATTGAALLPVGLWFTEDGWSFRVHPPIRVAGPDGVAAATQSLADVFAADIAAHPADWHMMQKLWLADLPPSRRRALERVLARRRDTA